MPGEDARVTDAILAADADGLITAWNEDAERLLGHSRSQALGQPLVIIVPEPLRAAYSAAYRVDLAKLAADGIPRLVGQTVELRGLRRDGTEFPIDVSLSIGDFQGRPGFTVLIRDVTERRRLHDELVRRADNDALTGVGNRSWFTREVAAVLQADKAVRLSILVLELQGLRAVDDSLGLLVGDRILIEVAERLGATLRPSDRLARVDNGDFAVLLPGTTSAQAEIVARRLRAAIPAHFRIRSAPVPISARIGLASHRGGLSTSRTAEAANRLLRNATLALAAARSASIPIAAYAPAMSARAHRRLTMHGALQDAVRRGELSVVYQPQVVLADNRLHAVEALARWTHPKLGAVSPAEFIPLAEDTGLASRLGAWVLRESCQQAVRWSRELAQPLPVSVNVSGRQLMDPSVTETLLEILEATGLDPVLLTLEITESVLMSEPDAVRERLGAIRALGVKAAIDDFGTGYSSLAALAQYPIDELKIDKSFVAALARDRASERVTRAVVELAHALDLRTVAEGIETPRQQTMLSALGCTHGQGELFARPLATSEIATWSKRRLYSVSRSA